MLDHYLPGKEKIYYRKNDFKKNRKTIIFVHGLYGSSSAWLPYEKIFEKKYNVLSIDLRGHGKSFRPKKTKDYAIEKFSEDLYKIIKKEKITRSILVGHSFGNLISLNFVKEHEDMVKALILISPDAAPAKRKIIISFLYLFYIINFFPLIKKTGTHVDYKKYHDTGDWNIKRMIADIKNTGLRSFLFSTIKAYNFDIEEYLPKIKIPVLIIHGGKDTVFPIKASIRINRAIKHSKLKIFTDSDHIIVLNNVSELSNEINNFITSL
jgi:pimeloyl-ACP methyl ester carboxylesterase